MGFQKVFCPLREPREESVLRIVWFRLFSVVLGKKEFIHLSLPKEHFEINSESWLEEVFWFSLLYLRLCFSVWPEVNNAWLSPHTPQIQFHCGEQLTMKVCQSTFLPSLQRLLQEPVHSLGTRGYRQHYCVWFLLFCFVSPVSVAL